MGFIKNERLLKEYGEEACKKAWNHAIRVGLKKKIWFKMWEEINQQQKSYLKTVKLLVLKDTDYAKKGEIICFTVPYHGYIHVGNGIYKNNIEIENMIGNGELYPTILMENISKCEDTLKLFEVNGTDINEFK